MISMIRTLLLSARASAEAGLFDFLSDHSPPVRLPSGDAARCANSFLIALALTSRTPEGVLMQRRRRVSHSQRTPEGVR